VDCRDTRRSRKDDWLGSKEDMSVESSSNLASKERRPAVVTLHRVAFQQVTGVWYFSIRLQACSGSSTAKKERT